MTTPSPALALAPGTTTVPGPGANTGLTFSPGSRHPRLTLFTGEDGAAR